MQRQQRTHTERVMLVLEVVIGTAAVVTAIKAVLWLWAQPW